MHVIRHQSVHLITRGNKESRERKKCSYHEASPGKKSLIIDHIATVKPIAKDIFRSVTFSDEL